MSKLQSSNVLGLCSDCSLITVPSLCQSGGHTHLADATGLIASSYTCALCNLIRRALDQNATRKTDDVLGKTLAPRPIVLNGIRLVEDDDVDQEEEPGSPDQIVTSGPLMLIGIEVELPMIFGDDAFDLVRLSLFAERDLGSEAQLSRDVIGTPLFDDPGSPDALAQLRRWFTSCASQHPACEEVASFLGSEGKSLTAPLPTRVLDVGRALGSNVRLLESNGARTSYAALSHCWGKNKFLTTTTINFANNLQAIAIDDLPKTFQDAVFICRKLEIDYLWIDSLCIIQDDPDDWRKESAMMGAVYKNAAITIAASGAEDGTHGCFLPRPLRHEPVRLPYITKLGHEEAVFADLFPDEEDGGLDLCPLGQRGWITQEWILSRRLVHYTKARMIWSCRTLVEGEDQEPMAETDEQRLLESARRYKDSKAQAPAGGSSLVEDMEDFFSNWCSLVTTYSYRSLTYEKDRPIAILGLGEEISAAVGESYTAGFIHQCPSNRDENVESLSLILQLFWFAKTAVTRPKHLQDSQPSWSWTSTIGSVSHHHPARSAKPLVQKIHINHSQQQDTLSLRVRFGRWNPAAYRLATFDLSRLTSTTEADSQLPRSAAPNDSTVIQNVKFNQFFSRSTYNTGASVLAQKAFCILGHDGKPFGWASFDLGVTPPDDKDIYVAVLSENETGGRFDGYNVMFWESRPAESDRTGLGRRVFSRLGIGEILDDGIINDFEMGDVVVI